MIAFQELTSQLKGLFSLNTKLSSINIYISLPQKILPDQIQDSIEKKFDAQESFKNFMIFTILSICLL